MRIAYVWGRPIPSRESDTLQVLHTVDALAHAGADVRLLVPATHAGSDGAHETRVREARDFYGVRAAFQLDFVKSVPPSRFELERATHTLRSLALVRGRCDVVYTRSRSMALACVAAQQPVVFETYRRLGHDSPRLARTLACAAKTRTLLGVVLHSRQALESLAHAGVPREKLATIYNGFDPQALAPRLSRAEARARLGMSSTAWIAAYTGHLRANKGVQSLLEVAGRVPELELELVGGDPEHVAAQRARVTAGALHNVCVRGFQPPRALAPFLHAADALLVPPTAAPLERYGRTVLPLKLFSYLGAGRPILAPDTPDVRELLVHDENAVLVPPDAPDAAADALRALRADPTRAERLSRAAVRTAEGFTWHARGQRLLEQIARFRTAC